MRSNIIIFILVLFFYQMSADPERKYLVNSQSTINIFGKSPAIFFNSKRQNTIARFRITFPNPKQNLYEKLRYCKLLIQLKHTLYPINLSLG